MKSGTWLNVQWALHHHWKREIPKSFSKQKRKDALEGILKPMRKPDIDNIAKSHLDAIQGGIIILDDKQVVNLHVTKVYAEIGAVEVMVKEDLV